MIVLLLGCREIAPPPTDGDPPAATATGDTAITSSDTAATGDSGGFSTEPLRYVFADLGNGAEGCGLLSNGALRCWGSEQDWLDAVPGPQVELAQLSITGSNKCGVTADADLGCWCYRLYGDVCSFMPEGEFDRVETSGGSTACAQRTDGTLSCWSGYPGSPNGVRDAAPTEPVGDFDLDSEIACAVRLDGSLTCWGGTKLFSPYNEADGDFGLGEAPPLDLSYTDVAVGGRFGCALAVDSEIHCWGINGWNLTSFPDAPPGPFTQVAASDADACGLHPDGTVECWGTTQENIDPAPPDTQTLAPDGALVSVALGQRAACGVRAEGDLVCWGEDPDGLFQSLPPPAEE